MMRFATTHEWVKETQEGLVLVGISSYALEQLHEIVYLQLPQVGTEVARGDEIAVIESTKSATDIYAPISGTIVEVNKELLSQLNLLNEDCEDRGWLVKMQLSNPEELKQLLTVERYQEMVTF